MEYSNFLDGFIALSDIMQTNESRLTLLDASFGDGDLGVSMRKGFTAIVSSLRKEPVEEIGELFLIAAKTMNNAAPSTLGTYISMGLFGIAHSLKGKTTASLLEFSQALEAGLSTILNKTEAREGDRTILDSLIPAVKTFSKNIADSKPFSVSIQEAILAAEQGVNKTKLLVAKHGRASYYGDQVLGVEDGGAVVGLLIFEAMGTVKS